MGRGKSVLPQGARKCIEVANQADALGIKTDEAWGLLLQIMRGEVRGRGVANRLRAAVIVLEQEIGKARQRIDLNVQDDKERFEVVLEDDSPAIEVAGTSVVPN